MNLIRTDHEPLSRDECLDLLATTRIGRVGFHAATLPVVLPVVYTMDPTGIVFRARAGSQLELATRDAVVAFECDDLDLLGGDAWSVAITGVARPIAGSAALAAAEELPLGTWAGDGGAHRFVRISLDLVSGRRSSVIFAARGRRHVGPALKALPPGRGLRRALVTGIRTDGGR